MTKTSIIVIDKFSFLDPISTSFYTELAKTVDELLLINMTNFDGQEASQLALIEKTIRDREVKFCLSINGIGLGTEFHSLLKSKSIPFSIWYWDHPAAEAHTFSHLPEVHEIFHGCDEFRKYPGLENRGEFLPFSGHNPFPITATPDQGICFLGTCWHIARTIQKVALGLTSQTDGKFYNLSEIYDLVYKAEFIFHKWQAVNGETLPEWEVLSTFSCIKRCQQLAWFTDLDLKIFGGFDWLVNCGPTAPELSKFFNLKLVKSDREMSTLMTPFKVSLNIFHLQNINGGPNFRILDSIIHGLPILSDYNSKCAEIYPDKEAALYYRNPSEAREAAKELLGNKELRAKLIKNSREIYTSGHLHKHRVERIWKDFGTPLFKYEPIISFVKDNIEWAPYKTDAVNAWHTDNYSADGSLINSDIYKTEKYWTEVVLFQKHEMYERDMEILKLQGKLANIKNPIGYVGRRLKNKINSLRK